jgi:hypothetical protein
MEQSVIDEIRKALIELENENTLIKEDIKYYENKLTPSKDESTIARRKSILLQLNGRVSIVEERLGVLRDLLKAEG